MEFENAEVVREREQRRGVLADRVRECIDDLAQKTAAGRLAWYRENRGRFFFDADGLKARIGLINSIAPSRRDELACAAGRLLEHEFDILGSGPVRLGNPIDWQLDFKSGIRWRDDVIYPAWNWRKVDDLAGMEPYSGHFYSIDDASDLKVPWDLSSFFHLPVLGEAFIQTGDPRYAREIVDQLGDWHDRNPFPRGVNWTCAMVAGIRLANIVFALRLIEPEDFIAETGLLSVLRHLKFILDYLEVDQDGRRNNHYLNNLVGLGFGAVEVAGSDLGRDLLDFVFEELTRELVTQFSEDGTNYEGSIPYHRFAAESCILTGILLERNSRPMPPQTREQLGRILRFIDFYTKPNGLAPQFGDNDNGRILVLHDYARQDYRDHRHILAVGAAWLGLEGLVTDVAGNAADAIWLVGRPPGEKAQAATAVVAGLYQKNGYALARAGGTSFLIRCGRINAMSGGGHNHCDQLSFEFQDRGQDIVIDPGAFVYSADSARRNGFRSTAAHNVLQLDDLEQHDFSPRDLFAMQDRAAAAVHAWEIAESAVFFRGEHSAYKPAGWKVVRECRCNLRDGAVWVCDSVEPLSTTAEGREFCGRLHLAAGIVCEQRDAVGFHLSSGTQQWMVRFSDGLCISLCPGSVSPSYGVALPSTVIEYRFPAAAARFASFVIERVTS